MQKRRHYATLTEWTCYTTLTLGFKGAIQHMGDPCAGQTGFVAKAGPDSEVLLEVWGRSRMLKQLKVPKKLHGAVYNDGWFGSGASWSKDEDLLAYVAEVRLMHCAGQEGTTDSQPQSLHPGNKTSLAGRNKLT